MKQWHTSLVIKLISAVFATGVQGVKITPMSTAPLRLPSPIHSINDGIPKELFSEHYMKVHSIIDRIMTHGECISYLPHPCSGPLSVMHKMAGHRGYYMAALCPMSRSASSFFHQSVPIRNSFFTYWLWLSWPTLQLPSTSTSATRN